MKSIDVLLDRQYDAETYHCVHFVIEAAEYLFAQNYSDSFVGLTGNLHESLRTSRHTATHNRKVSVPINGSIVLMTNAKGRSHVGLFYQGCVLHLTELGVHFLPVISVRKFYKRIRYYEPTAYHHQSAGCE
jgi:hypothetical protein